MHGSACQLLQVARWHASGPFIRSVRTLGGVEWVLSWRRLLPAVSHVVFRHATPPHAHNTTRTHTHTHTHTHTLRAHCPLSRSSILTHHPPIPPPTVQPCRARLLHRRGQARHVCGAVSRPVGVLRARPVRPAANACEARGALLHPRLGIWYGVCLRVLLLVPRTGSLSPPPSHASHTSHTPLCAPRPVIAFSHPRPMPHPPP